MYTYVADSLCYTAEITEHCKAIIFQLRKKKKRISEAAMVARPWKSSFFSVSRKRKTEFRIEQS